MFRNRVKKLQKKLMRQNVDALLITSVSNIAYLTGKTNFSIEEREAYLVLTKRKLYIATDKRYTDSLTTLDHLEIKEISHEFSFSKHLDEILKGEKTKTLGFEEEYINYAEFKRLKKNISKNIKLKPISGFIEDLRIIKDEDEIENIKKACQLTDKTFKHILQFIKLGVRETEIAAELEYFIKRNGGDLAFDSIVGFGINSAIPHHATSEKKLTVKDNVVLLDFGASINGYCSDMTRTVFIGKTNETLKKMYETTLEAQKRTIEKLSNNSTCEQIDNIARDYITKKGFPSIPHSLGHGVGLQVHEEPRVSPNSKMKLKPGMIITIEPGIYDISIGGIRIEDDVLITKNGIEELMKSPKELIEL